jgi:N-acetylglucosaminyldiphosphoundecaprenol N-acetyl-beta-D-mannosaminyltransferase
MRKLLIILGVPVDDLNMAQALLRLEDFIAIGRATGRTHQIATVNADFVVNSLHDAELRRILQESDMATADGMPLVLGARLLGVPLADRVTGADLVPALAERAAQKGYSIYLLGARPGVGQRAAEILLERYPGLQIAGVTSPPNVPIQEMDRSILDHIKAAKPDILLVAFGNPKQEKWIRMYAHELAVPVCIGVGGTFDMIAGITKRAPVWMQRAGIEWLFRLAQEPKRLWKRYVLDLFYFGYFFVWQWWVMRRGNIPAPLLPTSETIVIEKTVILNVQGRLDVSNQAEFLERAEAALSTTSSLVVNLSQATFLDSSAMGTLVALANRARAAGGSLRLAGVPPAIARTLTLLRLDLFFEMYADVEAAMAISMPLTALPHTG